MLRLPLRAVSRSLSKQAVASASRPALASSRVAAAPLARFPSTSTPRFFSASVSRLGSGETDAELADKLAQEISYEKESSKQASEGSSSGEPDFLRSFKEQGVWTISDVSGSDEISLTRNFGNEKIRVLFSIGDIDTTSPQTDEIVEDSDMDSVGDEGDTSFPVRCSITITKPGNGALAIDAQALDGEFAIENISFYRDSKLATELTAEADWARRGLYIGPQFETLDDQVQAQFEAYLEERGIATDLALFVPTFAEYKEQKEYCTWLENVKGFVDA